VNSEAQRMGSRSEAVEAWTAFYEADPGAAAVRVAEMAVGVSDELVGEWLGANLALTPREHRCGHWGDDRTCPTCFNDRQLTERAAKKEQGDAEATVERQSQTTKRQSAAMDRQSAAIRQLQQREQQLLARLASRKPKRHLLRRLSGGEG
jgi:hypothetical protein